MRELAVVHGQDAAKRALEVAAAGGHAVLLVGPSGSGKSLLAGCLPGLLPPLSETEAAAVEATYRKAGLGPPAGRPVRTPDPTARASGVRREFALAGHGTLVLDDLASFRPLVLEAIAHGLDDRGPAAAQVVATLRSCPCGGFGDWRRECACTPGRLRRHRARVTQPLAGRFDLWVEVPPVTLGELKGRPGETTAEVTERVDRARRRRAQRGDAVLSLDRPAQTLLDAAFDRLSLTARAVAGVLRVAATIAHLAGGETVGAAHLAEAIQYRELWP